MQNLARVFSIVLLIVVTTVVDMRKMGVLFPARPDRFRGLTSLLLNGYVGALSMEVKQSECEADHSPPFNADSKNAWPCTTSTPPYISWMFSSWE
jgi:hypothetical protein